MDRWRTLSHTEPPAPCCPAHAPRRAHLRTGPSATTQPGLPEELRAVCCRDKTGCNHCCFLHSHIPLNHTKSTRTSSEAIPSLLQSCFLAENSPPCQSFVITCVKSVGSSKDSLHLSRPVVYSRSSLQTATSGCVVSKHVFVLYLVICNSYLVLLPTSSYPQPACESADGRTLPLMSVALEL